MSTSKILPLENDSNVYVDSSEVVDVSFETKNKTEEQFSELKEDINKIRRTNNAQYTKISKRLTEIESEYLKSSDIKRTFEMYVAILKDKEDRYTEDYRKYVEFYSKRPLKKFLRRHEYNSRVATLKQEINNISFTRDFMEKLLRILYTKKNRG